MDYLAGNVQLVIAIFDIFLYISIYRFLWTRLYVLYIIGLG